MRPPKLFIASFVYLSISMIALPLFVEREGRRCRVGFPALYLSALVSFPDIPLGFVGIF